MAIKARGRLTGRKRTAVQYTVRDVPSAVDAALRRKAKLQGKSLNRLVCDALAREADLDAEEERRHHDLDKLAGLWEPDPAFDAAIAAQDAIDDELWR